MAVKSKVIRKLPGAAGILMATLRSTVPPSNLPCAAARARRRACPRFAAPTTIEAVPPYVNFHCIAASASLIGNRRAYMSVSPT